MYLMIGGNQYTVSRRIVTGDSVKFLTVTPEPEEVSGAVEMYRDDGFLLSTDSAADYERTEYSGTVLTLTNAPVPVPVDPPEPEPAATQAETYAAVSLLRMRLPAMTLTADETITAAVLYGQWQPGTHTEGDIRQAWYEGKQQPWKCRQGHDTAEHPDITPEGEAWRTFWVPFHGTTPETAQDWVAPTMAEDMYKAGEYMIWTDGAPYKCLSDTNFSPEEYPEGWEQV